MPYAIGLVCFGGEPADIPEPLIRALKQRVVEIAEAGGELFDALEPGDQVWIESGPFEGYRAIFDARLPGGERVRVLLQMLSDQYVPVELSAGWIEKAKARPSAFRHRR